MRVSVLDKYGYYIGDLRTAPVYDDVLNSDPSVGRCDFTISRSDPKYSKKYLQIGNYILIRDAVLPDWIGVIVKRTWNYGSVDILAMQAAYVLAKRGTPVQKITGTAGTIFTKFIDATNNLLYNEKPIKIGVVYNGGTQREETGGNDALSHLQSLASRTGNDFEVTYDFDVNGRLYLVANWYERRGVVTGKYFREGHNIELADGVLEEDGREMVNALEGRGDASTTGTRITSTKYDTDSIAEYGLNHGTKTYSGNKEQATLDNNVVSDIAANGNPVKSYDPTVLDVGDTFQYIGLGNTHEMDLNTSGFTNAGTGANDIVRTAGYEIDAVTRKVRLLVEVENA